MKMNNGRKQDRRKEAHERQEIRDKRTDTHQIKYLDVKLGKNQGAMKERERLERKIRASFHCNKS